MKVDDFKLLGKPDVITHIVANICPEENPKADCPIGGSDWSRRVDTDGQKWTRFDSGEIIGGIRVQIKISWYPSTLPT